jgi:glycosyltransferase involved in cell wall biosynthesis
MKILQIVPGKVWGGAEQYILDLTTALRKRGHTVTLVAKDAKAVTDRLQGEEFITLSMGIHCVWKLALLFRVDKYDVVHIHDVKQVPVVVLAKRISKSSVRIILTRHIARGSRTLCCFRPFFKGIHRIIFVSDLARRLWLEANRWMPKEKCITVLNSIPDREAKASTPSLRDSLGLKGDEPLLAFSGRVRRSKGCMTIIDALAEVKDLPFHLVYIGQCKPADYGQKLMKAAGVKGIAARISIYGFSDDVRSLIDQVDIGLAPSIVREACPLSPMEFMQAGKCVIATDNGGQKEYIINGETGILVPPDNPKALSAAIRNMLTNKNSRLFIGQQAKAHFETNMSYELFVDRILSTYNS